MKMDNSPRVTKAGANKTNYVATPVKMSSLKMDNSARNKIGSGNEDKNYAATKPKTPMGKEVGNSMRVNSHHKG